MPTIEDNADSIENSKDDNQSEDEDDEFSNSRQYPKKDAVKENDGDTNKKEDINLESEEEEQEEENADDEDKDENDEKTQKSNKESKTPKAESVKDGANKNLGVKNKVGAKKHPNATSNKGAPKTTQKEDTLTILCNKTS